MPKEKKKESKIIGYFPIFGEPKEWPDKCIFCLRTVWFHNHFRTMNNDGTPGKLAPHGSRISTYKNAFGDPKSLKHHDEKCKDHNARDIFDRIYYARKRYALNQNLKPWYNGRYIYNDIYYVDGLEDETGALPVYDISQLDNVMVKGEYLKIGHMIDANLVFIDPDIGKQTGEARANIVENDVKPREYHPLMNEKEVNLPEANVIIGNELIDTVKRLERDMSEATIKLETLRVALNDYVKMSLDGLQTLSKLVRNSDIKFDETLEPWTKEEADKNDSN